MISKWTHHSTTCECFRALSIVHDGSINDSIINDSIIYDGSINDSIINDSIKPL